MGTENGVRSAGGSAMAWLGYSNLQPINDSLIVQIDTGTTGSDGFWSVMVQIGRRVQIGPGGQCRRSAAKMEIIWLRTVPFLSGYLMKWTVAAGKRSHPIET